jgi:DNA-binding CsgD family transcriptional regulator
VILPRVIEAIGTKDFAAVTAGTLCEFLGFELTAVFVHPRACPPSILFDNFAAAEARRGIDNYIRFTHKINPMLARARPHSVCRARDFTVDLEGDRGAGAASHVVLTTEEELGFRTVGWPRQQEEICLYLQSCAGLIELGFYRERARTVAPDHKIRTLQSWSACIAAAFDRNAALSVRDLRDHDRSALPGALSPREREICDLLLLGCSTAAIASRLDIRPYTVKDHRKQIFRKLRVGSLAELFAQLSLRH